MQTTQGSTRSPKAFISYSWDSKAHKEWVRAFADRLVTDGVSVIFDQWHLSLGQSVTHFMETSIEQADFVLVICTPAYARKSNSRSGGVGYEQQIISAQIAQRLPNKRFVPILRKGSLGPGSRCAIPTHLYGLYAADLRRLGANQEYEDLLRAIFAKPRHQPPMLGEAPKFDVPRKRNAKNKAKAIRLPNAEIDGFALRSGVVANELHPNTFHIPSAYQRSRVKKGDIVKLAFDYAEDLRPELEGMSGERMWVKILGIKSRYYVGKLLNQPLGQDDGGWPLTWGDNILFLPEHVIDID